MNISENIHSFFEERVKKCRFLLIVVSISSVFLFFLNLYIGYEIILQFKGDGWSFFGGLFILSAYIFTIPANIFAVLSIKWIKESRHYKFVVPVILGVIGTLVGFLLYNAFEYWMLIVVFGVLLLISTFLCGRKKTSKSNYSKDKTNVEIDIDGAFGIFKKIKVIQIVGLSLLFLVIISLFVPVTSTDAGGSGVSVSILIKIVLLVIFVLQLVITVAFFKKRIWALKVSYFESVIFCGITGIIFLSFMITEGISLTNSFFAISLFFILLLLLFVYLILSYKKLKHSSLFYVLLVMFFTIIFPTVNTVSAQENKEIKEIYLHDKSDFMPGFSYVEFNSSDIKDYFNAEKSSKYPSINLFDGYLKTCWITGNTKTNKTSLLYIKVNKNIDIDKIILNIFSGYGKSQTLFNANARPKQIKVSVFAGFYPYGFSTEVVSLYLIKEFSSKIFESADTFGVQSFALDINKESFLNFQNKTKEKCKTFSGKEYNRLEYSENPKLTSSIILKIEIISSYSGTKYSDICISEIFFNDRFVTAYSDRYNQINNVYIKDDNTLLADYNDKKGVVICQDTSSVFSYVNWIKYSNWAILHYVPNSKIGLGSRIEELYALIDLKNKKIVEKEFGKCTGQYPLLIEKNKAGKILVATFYGKYKIELK